jgi:hypothetical protein
LDLTALQQTLAAAGGTLSEMAPGQWQIETGQWRLLVLTSVERDWLRMMIPLVPQEEAMPLAAQLLEANFDRTRETRFAFQNGLLWGMYQHRLSTIGSADLQAAVEQLQQLHDRGFQQAFEDLADAKLRQIVLALQDQAKSLEEALQLLERLYDEGVLGTLQSTREDRELTLQVWRLKLTRLWHEADSPQN